MKISPLWRSVFYTLAMAWCSAGVVLHDQLGRVEMTYSYLIVGLMGCALAIGISEYLIMEKDE